MKILMITPCPIFPTDQGNRQRIKALVTAIRKQGHTLDYLNILKEDCDVEKEEAFFGKGNYYTLPFHYNERLSTKMRRFVKKFTDRSPFYVNDALDDYCPDHLIEEVKRLHELNHYDIIWVEYVFLSRIFEHVPKDVFKVLDTHDLFADRYKRFKGQKEHYRWYSVSEEDEAAGLMRADVVLAIQEGEERVFKQMTDNKVPVLTIGHPSELTPLPLDHQPNLLYVASGNAANISAIRDFILHSYPIVKQAVPDVRLFLAGSICKKVEQTDPSIIKLGFVESLQDAYEKADIVINPVEIGTGLKIKCVEAMGFGRVLVTTPHGASGLKSHGNTRFVVAHKEDFAEALIEVLKDTTKRHEIRDAGVLYMEEINKVIENAIGELVEGGAQSL